MTTSDIKRLCKLWQKRLRITDWTISIAYGTPEQMGTDLGSTAYDPRNAVANVLIRPDPEDATYPDGGIEQTIIHELLHLVMHGWSDYEKEDIMQERSINQIADALFWAYQRRRRT